MHPPDAPRVCRNCPTPHIENCVDCFGFGVMLSRDGKTQIPVGAGEAANIAEQLHGTVIVNAFACPTCRSTVEGWKE